MKKLLLIFGTITFSIQSFSQGGNLLNSSFENWSTSTIFESPDYWGTGNFQEGSSSATATKSTDAQHLSYSIKLENYTFDNGSGLDTAFSYCFLGEIGGSGPDAGIPYATAVDRVNGFYKGTIGTNDTAFVMVIKFLAGNVVSQELFPITISQTNWTAFTFVLSPAAQDSIFLGMLSSSPFVNNANPATVVYFDNMSLSHSVTGAGPALPNYSFEAWTPVNSTTPNNWTTLNNMLASYSLAPVTESSNAYTGSSAARVETLNWNTDTIPGLLIYGNLVIGNQPTAVPYDATPTDFTGAYQYSPSNGDQGFISFELYSAGNVIGGNMLSMTASSVYVPFSVTTNLVGTPDSVIVAVYAGDNPGSFAIVDDLNFAGGNVSVNEITEWNYMVYPNPTTDFININGIISGNYQINLFDMNGRLVLSQAGIGNRTQLDVRQLTEGIYTLSLENNEKVVSKTITILN